MLPSGKCPRCGAQWYWDGVDGAYRVGGPHPDADASLVAGVRPHEGAFWSLRVVATCQCLPERFRATAYLEVRLARGSELHGPGWAGKSKAEALRLYAELWWVPTGRIICPDTLRALNGGRDYLAVANLLLSEQSQPVRATCTAAEAKV